MTVTAKKKKSKIDPNMVLKIEDLLDESGVGVVMYESGFPTMTEKGVDSEGSIENIKLTIKNGGEWEFGKKMFGLAKSDTSTNVLNRGDMVKITADSIRIKKDYIMFEVRSLKRMDVTRGKSIYEKKYQEYHRTLLNFKFAKEYHADTEDNFNFIKESIEKYVIFFPDESKATVYIDSELGSTTEIKVGMTVEEVVKILGVPKQKAKAGNKLKYKYDDWKITFVDGKVVEIDF
jgi:hypothetical protein